MTTKTLREAIAAYDGLAAQDDGLVSAITNFIEAQNPWIVTACTSTSPVTIVGRYSSQFEAEAVAEAWNNVNRRYGIDYSVEDDS